MLCELEKNRRRDIGMTRVSAFKDFTYEDCRVIRLYVRYVNYNWLMIYANLCWLFALKLERAFMQINSIRFG